MRVAILYNEKDVYIEFSPEVFAGFLEKLIEEEGLPVREAINRIVQQIKQEARKK